MFNLSPKEDIFYTLFIENAEIAYEAALKLSEYVEDLENKESNIKVIKEFERKGDLKVHEILAKLNKTFITPFDREDIFMITKEMDNIVDYIENSASRFTMFNVNTCTEETKELCKMIVQSTKELIKVMQLLKTLNKSGELLKSIIEVNRIEEVGDTVSRQAVKKIFYGDMPALEVIKWREIYMYLENTLDACEDVANMVEGVVMKNA